MDKETKPPATCKKCGRILAQHEKDSEYCRQCQVEQAEHYIKTEDSAPAPKPKRPSLILTIGKWAVLVASIVLITVNSIILIKILYQRSPREFVLPKMSKDVVLCLANLETLSESGGKDSAFDSLRCPLTDAPYLIKIQDGDTIISCPNPEKHKLRSLWISKKTKAVEVLK